LQNDYYELTASGLYQGVIGISKDYEHLKISKELIFVPVKNLHYLENSFNFFIFKIFIK
jgi:hypothetical protein